MFIECGVRVLTSEPTRFAFSVTIYLRKRGFPRIFVKGYVGTTNYYYYDFGLIKIYEMIFGLALFTTLA